jgi:hypothetical protein
VENGTGRHGPSIKSGLTKLFHFSICLRNTGQTTRVRNLRPLAYIKAQETDGGAKNVKSVLGQEPLNQFRGSWLGVPYKIAVLATLQ